MGLENGLTLHSKKSCEVEILIDWFCGWEEFDRWVHRNCKEVDEEVFLLDQQAVSLLTEKLKTPANVLRKLTDNQISYYDANGYPKDIKAELYGDPFMGYEMDKGMSVVALYRDLVVLDTVCEANKDTYITCYSSC